MALQRAAVSTYGDKVLLGKNKSVLFNSRGVKGHEKISGYGSGQGKKPDANTDLTNHYITKDAGPMTAVHLSDNSAAHSHSPFSLLNFVSEGLDLYNSEMVVPAREGLYDGLLFSPTTDTRHMDWIQTSEYYLGLLVGGGLGFFNPEGRIVAGAGSLVEGTAGRYVTSKFGLFNRGKIETGGRIINSIKDHYNIEKEALQAYETIRKNSSIDVKIISKNTGIPEYRVQRIKQHVFFNKHVLRDNVINRFDPDIEIADAWYRLQAGSFTQQDTALLQHEYFEAKFEGIFKTNYTTAHNASIESGRDWNYNQFTTSSEMKWRP